MAHTNIGCSGFSYDHWLGTFYPEGLAKKKWLEYYCSKFSTVELNVTFYRLVKPTTFEQWRDETPANFTFSVKGSRYITHIKRLALPEDALERFFEGVLYLEGKLAAVLWQLPPNMSSDLDLFARFLESLQRYQVRNVFEFRHASWLSDDVVTLCRTHRVSLCMADWPPFISTTPLTADLVYIRRHGRNGSYDGRYSLEELAADAQRIRNYMKAGKDVLMYFNNDMHGHAPRNALELMDLLGKKDRE
ncbi:DUF72 domain-containing protein [Pelotalea chapellei]|uniref:DUF72 domain-containing protein n=1 Tax=Pelotalea chapellei TaxID=44671 RepID=A0ABS5U580_9BACT|nr:DUF72 domain-containing protein [Pelotalea chapellei]MBT1070809.1 DUF72 domain-containing protein [Pelotalea chapellei]